MLLTLTQVVTEVLALTLGHHLSVEISLQVQRHQQAGQVLQYWGNRIPSVEESKQLTCVGRLGRRGRFILETPLI